MVTKLTTSAAVRVLLDGGCIAEMCLNGRKIRKYIVHKKNDYSGIAPHITPKQFYELYESGVICESASRTDKYGNIINFYVLFLG